ncbi:GntR family transcriptional regulator [Brevibacterium renqingii]|uniref:GntR family transcriptional regulator n=1 Tax=Brevibacterium renqingii TaxID=2776916 RepID=UPI001ADF2164|nr:GntR family transcriptional regulator [Brevibacterium renqingii]
MDELFRSIQRDLERQIRSGELAEGAKLPSENELCAQYAVSRPTAQRALNELAADGLVVRQRGRGTFVSTSRQKINLLSFTNPTVARHGGPGRHEVLSAQVTIASEAVLPLPDIESDTAVTEIERLKFDGLDRPQALETHVILFSTAPALLREKLEDLIILDHLKSHDVEIDSIRVYLEPTIISDREAELLDCEPGMPALKRRRELRAPDRSVLETTTTLVRPGTSEFFIELPAD